MSTAPAKPSVQPASPPSDPPVPGAFPTPPASPTDTEAAPASGGAPSAAGKTENAGNGAAGPAAGEGRPAAGAPAAVTAEDHARAEAAKDEGNKAFAAKHFAKAIECYSKAIELDGSVPAYYSNRAFAYIKEEFLGAAIADAEKAIQLDPRFIKAYYRRASAYLGMGKLKEAIRDLKTVLKLSPKDATATAKLSAAEKELRRAQFEAAIAVEDTRKSALELLGDIDAIVVEAGYDGPRLDEMEPVPETEGDATPAAAGSDTKAATAQDFGTGPTRSRQPPRPTVTPAFISSLITHLLAQGKLHRKYVYQMLRYLRWELEGTPSLVDVPVPEKGCVNLVGDVHGQFYDVVNLLERCGMPGEANYYLFNGDFVDRGSFSVEVFVLLMTLKLAYPKFVHLSRGNHEADDMNKVYGFEGEVKSKYSDMAFRLFSEVFELLPVAHVVGGRIFVVHGGLSKTGEEKSVMLADLRTLPRRSQPSSHPILSDLLWADPSPVPGYTPSKRGTGFQFGPDVSRAFLERNGLDVVVRSHEVKEEGYEVEHGGKLVTVFSAPNYCDQMGNKAAVIRVSHTSHPAPPLALPTTTPTSTSSRPGGPPVPKDDWAVAETRTLGKGKDALRMEIRKFVHVGHPAVRAMAYSPLGAGMMG